MTKEQEKAIEKIKRKIVLGKSEKNIGIPVYISELETVLSIIEEKDKVIDLMANHIATSDSDLCEYLDITTKCKYYAGDNRKTCDNCIKQYFENKAKEVK